jgi:acetylornithine deacetylase
MPSVVPSSIQMIRRLIGFPTVSRDSNLSLIEYVRDYLASLGAESRLTYNDERSKANLFFDAGTAGRTGCDAVGPYGRGAGGRSGMGQRSLRARREKKAGCMGRGTSDMKSFVAIALALAPEFVERGLRTPLHFAFSYDEEVGCIGVGRLIADLAGTGIKPRSVYRRRAYADASGHCA